MAHDPYAPVQRALDDALAAKDPQRAATACRRAHLLLARVATTPAFDARRSRAINQALRGIAQPSVPARGSAR